MIDDDLNYYSNRLAEEQARAAAATRPEVQAAHRLLFEIYSERVEALTAPPAPEVPAFDWDVEED